MSYDRKTYHRDYARRQRERQLEAERIGRLRCPKRHGPGVCGALLETVIGALGQTLLACPWCDRQRRGLCRDCPAPVNGRVGTALRCAAHQQAARAAQVEASNERHHDARLAGARKYYQANEERRARRNAYKRLYRVTHPEKTRAQKRREALRQPKRVQKYMARYRAKHREHYRERALQRYYEQNPVRPNPVCVDCGVTIPFEPPGRPMRRCDGCVWPGERRRREEVRARRAERAAAPAPTLRPRRIHRPKHVKYSAAGERLCLEDGCVAIVTGRAKKCDACKVAARREAHERLAALLEGVA